VTLLQADFDGNSRVRRFLSPLVGEPTEVYARFVTKAPASRLAQASHSMKDSATITLEVIQLCHLDSPREGTANQDSHKRACYRTNPINPPPVPLSGDDRRTEGAGRIRAGA
jgi:hypothetical protein